MWHCLIGCTVELWVFIFGKTLKSCIFTQCTRTVIYSVERGGAEASASGCHVGSCFLISLHLLKGKSHLVVQFNFSLFFFWFLPQYTPSLFSPFLQLQESRAQSSGLGISNHEYLQVCWWYDPSSQYSGPLTQNLCNEIMLRYTLLRFRFLLIIIDFDL